jgi:uncharacterized protein (TIGR02145 family)
MFHFSINKLFMKKKRRFITFSLLTIMGIVFMFTGSCKKKAVVVPPELTTTAVTAITQTTATSGGDITSDGGADVTSKGVCWGATANPTTAGSKTSDGTGTGSFTSPLTGLTANTTYHLRAYAANSAGTAYGSDVTFTTLQVAVVVPTLTTTAVTAIAQTTASSGGNITSDGGAAITARGVCWGTVANPTTADSKTSDATGTGTFTSAITGLTANTVYHVRAYATNSTGTGYGADVTFTTLVAAAAPTVTTTAITSITATAASSGGNVTADGGSTVSARGVCWSATANPTTADSKTSDGTGTGSFTSAITGLTANTTYHVRAYATNSTGTGYGADVTFTTAASATVPVLTTTDVTNITGTTATSGGDITSDGGDAVTARGVCWGATADPTIADSKTTDGTGIGTFVSDITGLTVSTTYHLRAYATNGIGTAYGADVTFTTTSGEETLTIDGFVYHLVTIGPDVWTVENLRATHYTNGDPIDNVTDASAWMTTTAGAYCYPNGDIANAGRGLLYNYLTLEDPRGLVPAGWHLPLYGEYQDLVAAYGGSTGPLKATGTTYWDDPNLGATNESGFGATGDGFRASEDGSFNVFNQKGYWWQSSFYNGLPVWFNMRYDATSFNDDNAPKNYGFSVRLVKGDLPTKK